MTRIPRRSSLTLSGLLFISICVSHAFVHPTLSFPGGSTQTISPETTSGLQAFYQALDYSWMDFDEGIPPFILGKIPSDINRLTSTVIKKRTFFMALLPMVLMANQEIRKERNELLQILERNRLRKPKNGDRERLKELSNKYGLRGRPLIDHRARTQLLSRIDTIPPSLVLAQAANESAWGTSRFAQLGNNLFGEWTFKPGTGIVPVDRPPGETYEVRSFKSIYESIRSYMNNLNRHSAYRKLRSIRSQLREAGQPVTGIALSAGLLNYSQRGEDYIKEINAMIKHNKLAKVNKATLRQPDKEVLTSISTTGSGLFSTRNRLIGHFTPNRHDP